MKERRQGAVILHLIGILYMFIGIALACDEFFVPALEVIGDKLEVSDDIAGATLMAAGGSAPELFTALIGTLITRTDIGFGTVVGSAVFNVLFVIAMCALASKEVLTLTWWPLARDCTYYLFSLIMLAIFFGGSSPKLIEWWEAFILLLMYGGYVFLMKNNQRLKSLFHKEPKKSVSSNLENAVEMNTVVTSSEEKILQANLRGSVYTTPKQKQRLSLISMVSQKDLHVYPAESCVTIFDRALENETKNLEKDKIKQMLEDTKHVDIHGSKDKFFEMWNAPPMSIDEFKTWYISVMSEMTKQVRRLPREENFNKKELEKGLINIYMCYDEPSQVAEDFFNYLKTNIKKNQINKRDIFELWYRERYFFDTAILLEETFPVWPDDPKEQAFYVLIAPLMFPMYYTIPDSQKSLKHAVFAFVISILWIGLFATFMVMWAETFGKTCLIPPKVMGLTIIAAGTSIPDLLSSMIVARKGKGDMAVSSSIGSNIFDILVGLPTPWLLGNAVFLGPIPVDTGSNGSILISIFVLMIMLGSTIVTIALVGWKLSKTLALIMLILYIIFLLQDLLFAYNIISI